MQSMQEQLSQARRSQGISQKVLGQRMGLPQSHVSAIETEKVDPRLSSILEMARLLNYEPILVPKNFLPAVRDLLGGQTDAPLWQIDVSEEDDS